MKKIVIILLILTSCTASLETDTTIERDFNSLLGKRITVEGISENTKHGAVVVTKSNVSIWIDKLERWPSEYYSSDDERGKTVAVTGIITETNKIHVYVGKSSYISIKEGDSYIVATGDDATPMSESENKRYLFKDASWQLID